MDAFVSDFLYAFRVLFKRPGLTLLAVLALAVSMGMSTTAFSTLNGMFFKPLPFKGAGELHHIYLKNNKAQQMRYMPIPYSQYRDIEDMESFSEVLAYFNGTINLSGKGPPKRYDGAFVSLNFLSLLGEEPLLGRGFSPEALERDGPRELLIGYQVWQDKFFGDPDIIGQVVRANGSEHVIVGVLPEGFLFPMHSQVWMPVNRAIFPGVKEEVKYVMAIGRLSPGATHEGTREELLALYSGWEKDVVESKDEFTLVCEPFGRLPMNRTSEALLMVAIAAVIFILLVSCANVANLLVGRALTRGREMAIRSAIGATRSRIIRQLLTESLLLSLMGAVGGLLYAAWAVDLTMHSQVYEIPYWMSFELDWRVFMFALGVTFVTALVSGLIPAWQASKIDLNEMLKDTSHTSTSFRLGKVTRMLAVIQIAFSCALLFGAGLVTRNVYQMTSIDPGYDAAKILTMRMGLFPGDYPTEEARDAFYRELIQRVEQVPGIESGAVTSWIGQFGNYDEPFLVPVDGEAEPEIVYSYTETVSPEYFETFDLKPVSGRLFDGMENGNSGKVVVVNESYVRECLRGADPLGLQVNLISGKATGGEGTGSTKWEIIGVVPDVRVSGFTRPEKTEPIVYLPYTEAGSMFMTLAVRSDILARDEIRKSVEQIILDLDPNLPVYFVQTMEEFIDDLIYPYRTLANFFLTIGLMALFLAAIGVYGMLAFNVSRRRREIGIRMALGADTLRIVTQVLRQGFSQVVIGILVGTGLAYVVGRMMRDFMLGINPLDPSVYTGVLLTLVGVATLAFFIPARRAARLSPMDALRYE
jgi:predicted permease